MKITVDFSREYSKDLGYEKLEIEVNDDADINQMKDVFKTICTAMTFGSGNLDFLQRDD